MKINLTQFQINALREYLAASPDCEALPGGEWVADIYETDTPITITLALTADGAEIEGAEYLLFDDESDGWYMASPVESAEKLTEILLAAGAIPR